MSEVGHNIYIPTNGGNMSIYEENGFENRKDYLENLAEWNGVDKEVVFELASILGPTEDFDGLVTSVEDYADGYY
jgi:hypothetical protein